MAQKPETVAINGKPQEAPQANAEKGLAMLASGTALTSVRNSQGRRPRLKTHTRLLWQFRNVRYSAMSGRFPAVDQASRLRNRLQARVKAVFPTQVALTGSSFDDRLPGAGRIIAALCG
jgi:hypothetical protein